jgi:hypothetical protein
MRDLRKFLRLLVFCLAASLPGFAQSSPNGAVQPSHFVVYESFAGDTNADGQVMALTSSVTYYFADHLSARAGLPIYFDRATSAISPTTTSAAPTTFSSGIGDIFLTVRAGWKEHIINYSASLTGTLPTGDSSQGFSTGHFTFDWSNRLDRTLSRLTPFIDVGLANSVMDTPYFLRPFATLGPLAHFEGGAGFALSHAVNVTVTAYDVAPWGTQTLISRVVAAGSPANPGSTHGRAFENAHQTTGTASLTHDDGVSASLMVSPNSFLDLNVGYTRSAQYALDTVSFGIGVNVTALLEKTLRP